MCQIKQLKKMHWESFQHMTNSFLAKMKLSTISNPNEKQALTSWKSASDPSIGSFSASLVQRYIPELFIWNCSSVYWRSGPIGVPKKQSVYINGFDLVMDQEGTVYLSYNLVQPYLEKNSSWKIVWSSQVSDCDVYGQCGPFGICNARNSPICSCLRGFEPKNSEEWSRGNWSSGCIRKLLLQCNGTTNGFSTASKKDGFLKMEMMKVPNSAIFYSRLENDCPGNCSISCSCVAYAYDSGVGCMFWTGDLIDLQKFSGHLREIVATTIIMGTLIVIITIWFARRKAKKQAVKEGKEKHLSSGEAPSLVMLEENLSRVKFQEFVIYKIDELVAATGNFGEANKLGRGWFRLLGCCFEGDEKMLICEFMPNKSLDTFLFDPLKQVHLDWRTRFNIVDGISRGLLYLHRDSRLRIIHRDLKASNILLDEELNPKISDFRMARIFGENENQANTQEPNVFSFSILLLEIVSGRRNTSFHYEDQCLSLLGLNVLALVDPSICLEVQLSRCINVGLLCTQERAKDILTVISMINSEVDLPHPKKPAFTSRKITQDIDSSGKSQNTCSANDVTLTVLQGR
ncbi:hypothetical protein ACJRO7_017464 [Eucalyptus globulus]|uniref:non-specific serine/threonine protein kinase n=1 Tax=Eucalyptus globulus TaxID=34317 RepID=A0ABD3KUR1_EUCGL